MPCISKPPGPVFGQTASPGNRAIDLDITVCDQREQATGVGDGAIDSERAAGIEPGLRRASVVLSPQTLVPTELVRPDCSVSGFPEMVKPPVLNRTELRAETRSLALVWR